MKPCPCGLVYDAKGWQRLDLVGYQLGSDAMGDPSPIELRNCTCGSTIVLRVTEVELRAHVDRIGDRVQRSAAITLADLLLEQLDEAAKAVKTLERKLLLLEAKKGS